MAKMNLLEIVQDILSDMDSDEINSINDTLESVQVAQIVKTTYYNILDGKDFPFLYELFQLSTSGTTARPTHMRIPDTIMDLDWIKYNVRKSTDTRDKFQKIQYKSPEDFVEITDKRISSDSNISTITDASGIKIYIYKDRAPTYFTSFDDDYLVFDAYDSAVETTLQNSKTQCHGKKNVSFTLSDAFIPDLPVQMFSYLLSEAKSTAFLTLKQMANPKAEQISVSQKRRMSQEAWKLRNGISYPHYGRK